MTSCIHPFPLEYILTFVFMDKKLPYIRFQINVMNTMVSQQGWKSRKSGTWKKNICSSGELSLCHTQLLAASEQQ